MTRKSEPLEGEKKGGGGTVRRVSLSVMLKVPTERSQHPADAHTFSRTLQRSPLESGALQTAFPSSTILHVKLKVFQGLD